MCPEDDFIELYGNFYSSSSKFLSLQISKCDPNYCEQYNANNFFYGLNLNVIVKNTYFDYTNIDEPVQTYFDGFVSYIIDPFMRKNYFYYVKKSQYELKEGWTEPLNPPNGEFYSIDKKEVEFSTGSTYQLIQIDFIIDPKIDQYERSSLTFFEAFGTIGGVFEIIAILMGIFVGWFSKSAFRQSILNALKKSNLYSFDNIFKNDPETKKLNDSYDNFRSHLDNIKINVSPAPIGAEVPNQNYLNQKSFDSHIKPENPDTKSKHRRRRYKTSSKGKTGIFSKTTKVHSMRVGGAHSSKERSANINSRAGSQLAVNLVPNEESDSEEDEKQHNIDASSTILRHNNFAFQQDYEGGGKMILQIS